MKHKTISKACKVGVFAFTFNSSSDRGFNRSSEFSELLHMFSENIGNTFAFDT